MNRERQRKTNNGRGRLQKGENAKVTSDERINGQKKKRGKDPWPPTLKPSC